MARQARVRIELPMSLEAETVMGGATSSERQILADEGVVTVHAATDNSSRADHDTLERLSKLPQVQPVNSSKGPEDQLWRELTSYSQDQLQLDPDLTLRLLNTYKTWCKSQASLVAQQQDFVNSRIAEVDKLASEVLEQCVRRQETLQNATQSFKSLPATQQQMEELSSRLAVCASAVAVARIQMAASRGAGKS